MTTIKRWKVLFQGSYRTRRGDKAEQLSRAEPIARALGDLLIRHDFELILGGTGAIDNFIGTAAMEACQELHLSEKERIRTYLRDPKGQSQKGFGLVLEPVDRRWQEVRTFLVNECEEYDIPVMAVTAVGKELEKRTARFLALACRIAAELGAKVVKTYYCAEDFEKVTNGCPVPIVIAGGPRCETEMEVFEFVYDGIQKGAIGINLGRNIWQNEHPAAMMRALNSIVHDKTTPKQALDLFQTLNRE